MDMALSPKHFAVTLFLLFDQAITVYGGPSACLAVYQEGGAPAVFQSSKCPGWKLPGYDSLPRASAAGTRCQVSTLQGRRRYQEDRTFCALDVRIPFPTCTGPRNVTVGIAAVFDGHGGAEASEMASKLLFDYFMVHAYFLLDSTFSIALKQFMGQLGNIGELDANFQALNWNEDLSWQELDQDRVKTSRTSNFDNSHYLEILKEALLRAIQDIDAKFSKEAARRNLDSGSTATVILMADGKVLVANVGDSKALLCSERFQSPADARATLLRLYREKRRNGGTISVKKIEDFKLASLSGFTHFSVQELTRDHNPKRDDERSRVEAAGGYVLSLNGVPRVNGQLAVSRAIGDVKFKSSGVIAAPEVMEWQSLNINDSYLVAASDGVFEELSPQDVCDILWEAEAHGNSRSEMSSSCSYSLANCIVETAFEKGSRDNVAAVVVPLQSTLHSHNIQENRYTEVADLYPTAVGSEHIYMQSGCTGPRNVTVGIVAVFDGHGGAEASEMASKLLFDYFMLHTHFLTDTTSSVLFLGKLGSKGDLDAGFQVDDCCAEMILRKLDRESYGVTATPEVTDWRSLGINDTYLVVASDGILEGMSPQVVCDILSENSGSRIPLSGSLADCIVRGAFEKGSWDNLSAAVVPLQSIHVPDNVQEDSCAEPAPTNSRE